MKLLAIDGNSIMNRAFYGIKLLSNSKGLYTNALTGFLNIYLKEISEVQPDCCAVAFDLREPTFRHKASSAYKANRKGMPEELAMQMPVIKKILTALGCHVIEKAGFEADDVLGTLSRIFSQSDNECFILTGDRDSFQLINDKSIVRLATTKETKIYTPQRIQEEYGVSPRQMIEVKALMGDSSDNISGVKGIGEKTALQLIEQYASVDGVYENLETAQLTKSVKAKLEAGHQDAIDSRFLAEIVLYVPIDESPESYKFLPRDEDTLKEVLTQMEMFKLMERLSVKSTGGVVTIEGKKVKAEDLEKFDLVDFDMALIIGKSAFLLDGEMLKVYVDKKIMSTDDENKILDYMSSPFDKQTFDGKVAYKYCFSRGRELVNLKFSCDLAGYLLNSQSKEYTLENLCESYNCCYRSDMEGNEDIATLSALCDCLSAKLEAGEMTKLFDEIEMPLCQVLAAMEVAGIKADTDGIRNFGNSLTGDINRIQSQIYEYAGKEFNIASPKQLGVVLFEDLKLACKKKTKSGYSTNAEVLEGLADKHPIIPLILEYRTLAKLMSTYVKGLLKVVADDGRIHSYFKQTETRTGRISSTEPNLQNIPVRKEIGRNMRKFFIAEEGKILVDADYSQIELRVLASVCDDDNMKEAFLSGADIHTSTAANVFGLPEDFVSPEMRSAAKAVNFGIIYGIGAFSLSKDIGVSVAEAKQYIASYLENYPKISEYMESTVDFATKNGYVTTLFGRRRYIPELSASNKMLQAFGKRVAMNAPIQGAAADIIKIAMINVYNRLKKEVPTAKLILQIHDELIIECDVDDGEKVSLLLKEEMETAVELSVPMTVDVHTGESWYIAKQG